MLSIVMPSFNQADFIAKSIDSVFNQNLEMPVELIIYDGLSSDGTRHILEEKQDEHPRLKWISERDTGPANAINKALADSRGAYIGWLNSDDLYRPDAFSNVLGHFAMFPNEIMVYGQGQHIDASGHVIGQYPTLPPSVGFDGFKSGCFICQPTVFFKRSLYTLQGGLNESYKAAFDYEYWMRAFQNFPDRIGFIDKPLAQSRLHADCITLNNRTRVVEEGARVTASYFGQASVKWLRSYIQEMQSELNRTEYLAQSESIIEFLESTRDYFAPSEFDEFRDRVIMSFQPG